MAETEVAVKPVRVVELKGNQKPPIGKPYYGRDAGNGFREVLMRTERTRKGGEKVHNDLVQWYETTKMDGGDMLPLVCHVGSAPTKPDPDVLYPVAIWNVSNERLDVVDYVPFWQKRQLLDDNNNPIHNADGLPLMAQHYVVVNNRYTPNRQPDGRSDDGNWMPGEPVSGEFLLRKLGVMEEVGGDPMDYRRRRVS
jgi:hypothetical protein